jgi:Na+/proline symporter
MFSIFSMLYISWGGIKAVIWTNVWQSLTFIISGIASIIFLVHNVDGGLAGIFHTASAAGRMQVFNWGPNISDANFWSSVLSNPNIWWLAILNGFFGSMAAYGTDHELMQRLLTLETREKSQKTTLATPIAGLFVLSLYMIIGSGLYAFYSQHTGAPLPEKLDDIYAFFASTQMPALLRGLVLSAVVMASIDSPLGSLSASFVTDIYRPLIKKNETDAHYVRVARLSVPVFSLLLMGLAYAFSFLSGFLWWAFKIGGVTFGSLLGVFLLGLFTKRHSNKGNCVAMVTLALVNLLLLILTEKNIFVVGWTWLVLIGTFGTMGLGYVLGPIMDGDKREI